MLPMRFFRSRAFAATNGVSLAMTFGIFGSIFLLAQFFQSVQGYSPLEAGLRTLPWTGDADARRADRGRRFRPARLAPADGGRARSCRPRRSSGSAVVTSPDVAYGLLVPGVRDGRHRHGARLRARRQRRARRRCGPRRPGRPPAPTTRSASWAACSASPCSPPCSPAPAGSRRRRRSSTACVPALWVGAAVLAAGALTALLVPGQAEPRRGRGEPLPVPVAA